MTAALLATFASEAGFVEALREARRQGLPLIDGYAPFLPEAEAEAANDPGPRRVTAALAIGGLAAAGAFYLLEVWTATSAYPFNSGGRPTDSWPAFIMGPFEFGVFCAGFCGFVALLFHCGLPRPHQPLFAAASIGRASQDGFVLALASGESAEAFAQRMGAVDLEAIEL